MLHAMAVEAPPQEEVRHERSFTDAGTVVLDDVAGAHAPTFGPVAFGVATGFSIGWASYASTVAGNDTARMFTFAPTMDVFVADGFSLGGTVGLSAAKSETSGMTSSAWAATLMPRIGEAFALSRDVFVWPRIALGITLADGTVGASVGRGRLEVPFVFTVARHVAFDVGPDLSYTVQLDHGDVRTFAGGVNGGLSLVF